MEITAARVGHKFAQDLLLRAIKDIESRGLIDNISIERKISRRNAKGFLSRSNDGTGVLFCTFSHINVKNGEADFIGVIDAILTMYHEEGHADQFKNKFSSPSSNDMGIAKSMLLGQYMPEYAEAVKSTDPAECDAKLHAIQRTRLFLNDCVKEGFLDLGGADVDSFVLAGLKRENPLMSGVACNTLDVAESHLRRMISMDQGFVPPDKTAAARVIGKKQSDMAYAFSRGNLHNAYMSAANRGEQENLLMEWIAEHPTKILDSYPNLKGWFRGIDLSDVPASPGKAKVRFFREGIDDLGEQFDANHFGVKEI